MSLFSLGGDQVLRLQAETEDHVQLLWELKRDLKSGVDFWTHGFSTQRPVDVFVPHARLNAIKDILTENNITFSVMINDVQELLEMERAEMMGDVPKGRSIKTFNFAAYHNLDAIYSFMDTLVASHGNLISKVNIGSTFEKRSMYVLKFSTGGEKKPAIWIDAGIHAREWVSQASAVWIADRIATDFKDSRAPVPSILSKMDIYLMIVANPDGYVFSHLSTRPFHRLWRKSRSLTSNPNCPGVDLNRNFDAEFSGPGASDDPCGEDYRGPSAESEIEVKNIVNFIKSHGNFKSFMSLHAYSQLLMYPYGYTNADAPDKPELHEVATQANRALNSWHGTIYKVGSIFHTIEQASGASVDWAYQQGIKYSFAFELRDTGKYGFLLPADQIQQHSSMRLFLSFVLLLAAVHCEKLFNGDQVLRVYPASEEHIQLLRKLEEEVLEPGVDFWTHGFSTERPVDIFVPHDGLVAMKDFFTENRIPFSVMINNVQDLLDLEKAEMVSNAGMERNTKSFNFAAYHNLDTIYSFMDTLVASHPNLVSKINIGNSYENRPMYALKFSTGGVNRPAIWVDAGIHAREWVTQASAVWIANKIASDYGVDPSVTSLLGQMDIYLMIVTNPDGYVFTHTSNRMWRTGASKDPCSDSYHGPYANSEIEVKNVVELIKGHGNFKSFISIHSYSQLLMYPYGYTCTGIPDQSELHAVGTAAIKELSTLYNTRYQVGSICKIIYPASGGSIDWTYNIGIKYSFAFELRDTGFYGFLLPANQILPTAQETWLGLKYIMKYVQAHPY
ncbi:hypothetical protein DNTS_033393 [Danionella cerebrum]|uniref:Peptidase M14 domain-containing protein n=1 Tax=Danionella cerebrum TaxID=2873325 RepID=A0A553MMW3_9TELE|nr:hypothetical protein DNTS_033393 [Danionella translucida]